MIIIGLLNDIIQLEKLLLPNTLCGGEKMLYELYWYEQGNCLFLDG